MKASRVLGLGIGIACLAEAASAQVSALPSRITSDTAFKALDLGPHPEVTRGTSRLDAWIEDRDGKILGKSSLTQQDFRDRAAQ